MIFHGVFENRERSKIVGKVKTALDTQRAGWKQKLLQRCRLGSQQHHPREISESRVALFGLASEYAGAQRNLQEGVPPTPGVGGT